MTSNQYRSALKRLGLSQGSAAKLLGVSVRTSNGYANGGKIPKPVGKLLELIEKYQGWKVSVALE